MVDAPNIYRGGSYAKSISWKDIETMKKNMKKVPTIQLKSDVYHNKEAVEADEILQNITRQNDEGLQEQQQPIKTGKAPWYKKLSHRIHNIFTSFF